MLPLTLDNVSPGLGFIRLESKTRPDGLLDGIHTGSAWLSPDKHNVWKPLDAKPNPNADRRLPTMESRCLSEMTDVLGHLDNWHEERQNGRLWLVRPRCYLWPQDRDILMSPNLETFLMIEQAIFEMNARGWEYNDLPQLAYDPTVSKWFLMDHSAAFKPEIWRINWHGDRDKVLKWFNLMGLENIASLRQRGYHIHHAIQLPDFNDPQQEPYNVQDAFYPMEKDERQQYIYLYASTLRPMSKLWADIEDTVYLHSDASKRPLVHTWIASKQLLDSEIIQQYELTFVYRPWP